MLELGYKASAEQFSPRQLLAFGVLAEECGFDSVLVSDHFHPWEHSGGHSPFAWTWLGALGERTSHVRIGTSVVAPTFRYHPAVIAQAMATLATMYPRRTFFGVGSGEALNETPATGMEMPPFKERYARLVEALKLMRRLWTEEFVTFDGQYYHTRDATIYDLPPEGIQLYVAASGPKMAELAGRVGNGLITTSGKSMSLYRDQLLPAFERGAREAGRNTKSLDRMIEMKVSFSVEDARQWPTSVLSADEKTGVHDPRELEARSRNITDDQLVQRWITSADPGVHVREIEQYIEMGFTNLVFHGPGDDQARFIQTYGTEVLPPLRRR
ncbi:MAG: TIGR03557 family F420-dependent LLM class oxidoreductase, partial [Chloroflexota bacterium]|nr:TIGR03557 family F420-dependent LLM class oxidoreductase [Chloroflexota bacterium]